MPWMETGAGHVEMLIGLDNRQWLPAHVEDSWNPDDDMRLMRSAFGYRFMITDGWGRDLFPPDNPQGGLAGAQGGSAEAAEGAREGRFSWKSTEVGVRARGAVRAAAHEMPRTQEVETKKRIPKTVGGPLPGEPPPPGEEQARGVNQGRPMECTGTTDAPCPVQNAALSRQVRMLLRPKREIPPPRRRMPTNPQPVHPQQSRDGRSRGGRGRGGAEGPQQPGRQLLANPGGIPGLLQSPGTVDPTQRLAVMMAVMVLGMPPVHSCHTGIGSEALGGGGRMEPRTYLPILTRESKGIPATGEQNRPTALHKTSPAEQDESALASLTTDPAGGGERAENERGDTEGEAGDSKGPPTEDGRDAKGPPTGDGRDAENLPARDGGDTEHPSAAGGDPEAPK
jgi:hypothetical protein